MLLHTPAPFSYKLLYIVNLRFNLLYSSLKVQLKQLVDY